MDDVPAMDGAPDSSGLVKLAKYLIPGNPAIEVTEIPKEDLQCQWNVVELLQNLVETKSHDKIYEMFKERNDSVAGFHHELWPGYPVPTTLKSKHDEGDEGDQAVYLKKKTVATSTAIAWIMWGVSHPKRIAAHRRKAWDFFVQLFDHAVREAGRLTFRFKRVGEVGSTTETRMVINIHNPSVEGSSLWTEPIKLQLRFQWETCRLDDNVFLSSVIERPKVLDIIWFGLSHATGRFGEILRPLALTLVAQFAAWLDDHFQVVAIEVHGFSDTRLKNRTAKEDALKHALWKAIEFFLHENDIWHSSGYGFSFVCGSNCLALQIAFQSMFSCCCQPLRG